LLINGGGAVALLALLPNFLDRKHPNHAIAVAILSGVVLLMFGLAFAVIHNHLRRKCSLASELKRAPGRIFGRQLKRPLVCFLSDGFMWSSIATFVSAGLLVAIVGLASL
jgi:hypothetical protein